MGTVDTLGTPAPNAPALAPAPKEQLQVQDDPIGEESIEYPTGFKFVVVLLAMCVSLVLTGLDFNMIATALPTITTHFGTVEDVGWYYSAYRLTSCSFQFMFGKLYHLYSVKYVFLASVFIFEIGSLLAGAAPNSAFLVLGRAVSGMGCAGIISGLFTMIVQSFPLRRRPFFTGIAAGIEGASATVAPLLGGALTDSISWRWCFYINLPVGCVSFLLVLLFFQDPQKNASRDLPWREKLRQLDLLGTSIFVPSITSLLLALQWGGYKYGWGNARIIVLFVVMAALLGAFLWQERRKGDNALLPGRILRSRSLLAGMWFSFCNNSVLSVIEYYMPTYFQVVRGTSATASGVMSLPIATGVPLAVFCGSSATSLLGYYAPFMIATGILTPIAAGLLTTLQVKQSLASLICYQALLGVGAGVGFQGPQVAAQTVLSIKDSPMGIALIIFAQNFGPALFVSIAQTIFTGQLLERLGSLVVNLDTASLSAMGMSDLENYRTFISYGPGGVPYNFLGWFAASVILSPWAAETLSTEVYARKIAAGETASYLSDEAVKARKRDCRPEIGPHVAPQRQVVDFPAEEIKEKLNQSFYAFANRNQHLIKFASSNLELHADALFLADGVVPTPAAQQLKGELAHIHRLKDFSLHMTLAPADCKKVLEANWGQRHSLSGVKLPNALLGGRGISLPSEYVFIYAPRTEEEVVFLMEILAASVKYLTGSVEVR
ncbi:hypothetical protein BBP40_004373 [Aspergillus hancockii]|nr:hypothetical protein BBP40_004373 [Aspergillus hancockii]